MPQDHRKYNELIDKYKEIGKKLGMSEKQLIVKKKRDKDPIDKSTNESVNKNSMLFGQHFLPVELALAVFNYLSWNLLLVLKRVSRQWKALLSKHSLHTCFDLTRYGRHVVI